MDGLFSGASRGGKPGRRRKSDRDRQRRNAPKATGKPSRSEPVLIVARRPDSPLLGGRRVKHAASTAPTRSRATATRAEAPAAADATEPGSHDGTASAATGGGAEPTPATGRADPARRAARIVRPAGGAVDPTERERLRLLDRLLASDGRVAISKAANEYLSSGFTLPQEQAVQLQMLEHFDETRAAEGLAAIRLLLAREPPLKKPVLDQRLRRLEQYAEEPGTRDLAADLRRSLRS